MSKVTRKLLLLAQMSMLGGCALDGSLSPEQQLQRKQNIERQYTRASQLYKQKMAPIAQYIVNVCGPKPDKEYVDCINAKRTEIKTLSIYPENASARERRLQAEKQLIEKKIDRKQFRAKLEEIRRRYDAERLQLDISAGVYSGQY